MKKLKNIFLCFLCAFCVIATNIAIANACTSDQIDIGTDCIDTKFTITTTNLSAGTTFKFVLSAKGTFYVDWDGVVDTPIVRNNTTPTEYSYTFPTAGIKKIRFGGVATEYNTTAYNQDKDSSGAAIRFGASNNNISTRTGGTPTLIASIDGSIGSAFPTLNGGTNDSDKPTFFDLCNGCTNLQTISGNLFSGVTTAKKNLFRSVFDKCTNLTSIPATLFSYTYGSAESMFRSAFYQCKNLSVFPDNLFPNIDGAAANMFMYTFFEVNFTTTDQYIPGNTFLGLRGQTATNLFNSAFKKSNLVTSCPDGTDDVTNTYYSAYKNSWDSKKACAIIQHTSCTGAEYLSGSVCLPCPSGYDGDVQDGKTSISDCKISCPAGKWTGEYERLSYIEANGTQYIDTGHVISSTSFKAELEYSSPVEGSGTLGHFGGNQDALNGHAANFKENKFGVWVAFANAQGSSTGSKITVGGIFNAGEIKHITYEFTGNNRSLSVDNASTSGTFSGSIISNNKYRLFSNGCVGGCNDTLLTGRIHWFKMYENGTLIFDFVPARRMSDNAIGMYDLVSGRFFGNSGSGDFVAGSVLGTFGGSSCENVGIGYYSSASMTSYGSVSQRTQCAPGDITLTETSTSSADCVLADGFTVCSAGKYIPANSQTCTLCTAGNWCPGGQLYFDTTDQGLNSCATEIGSGWSSDAGSDEQTDCYYLITLHKNGYSGIIEGLSGIGCYVASVAEGTTNAQLKLFYNTACTLPAISLPAPGGNGHYDISTSWAITQDITDNTVTTIAPVITTPAITTYYARKSCATNYYKSGSTTCSACGSNSSTVVQNAASACTCDTGYTADGTPNGATTSVNGCLEIVEGSVSCNNGYYLPANSNVCAKCLANNYCPSGTYTFDQTNNQGINSCSNGLVAPVGMWESAQCGRILHVGQKYVYLRSTKQMTPSLNVDIDNDGVPDFFANIGTTPVPMNADFSNLQDGNKLMVNINGSNDVYYIYDDTVSAN
jgi:hypothetical protein